MKTGIPKVDEFDPSRPWVKDARGRYHNLLAILDWPEEESDDEQSRNTPSTPPADSVGSTCRWDYPHQWRGVRSVGILWIKPVSLQ